MNRSAAIFGLKDANEKTLRLARTIAIFAPILVATIFLSTTFYVIFIAEALGSGDFIRGMELVGVLVVIQLAIQLLFDYPTGAIGDWIGQRYILFSAFLLYGVSFYMVSLVTSETSFLYLILIYILQGLAISQESGAWPAWFDNNYRAAMPGDTDRKQYGIFQGRLGMFIGIVSTLALIPGSVLAVILGRPWVFQFQAVMSIIIAFLILHFVKDFPEVEAARKRPTMSEYTSLLKDGIHFLLSDPFVKYLVLGSMVAMSCIIVWGNLVLFPMYYSYLVNDVAVAMYRTLIFIPGIISQERSGVWSRRFEPKKWIPRFLLLQTCGFAFFWVFASIMFVFPPVQEGSPVYTLLIPFTDIIFLEVPMASVFPAFLIFITFTSTGFISGFVTILTMRVLLDVIPNRIRNSMYSLQPTIATLIALPQIALFGWTISNAGFPLTLLGIGLVALLGALLSYRGLAHPPPVIESEAFDQPTGEELAMIEAETYDEIPIAETKDVFDDTNDDAID